MGNEYDNSVSVRERFMKSGKEKKRESKSKSGNFCNEFQLMIFIFINYNYFNY